MKRFIVLFILSCSVVHAQSAHNSFELIQSQQHETNAPKIFGYSHKNVLAFDGDPNGSACSTRHKYDDLSNRWCHSLFVKLMDEKLRSLGLSKNWSALVSASIFIPKEYMIDKNPSLADLMIAEYALHEFEENSGKVAVSLFADGATILSFNKSF